MHYLYVQISIIFINPAPIYIYTCPRRGYPHLAQRQGYPTRFWYCHPWRRAKIVYTNCIVLSRSCDLYMMHIQLYALFQCQPNTWGYPRRTTWVGITWVVVAFTAVYCICTTYASIWEISGLAKQVGLSLTPDICRGNSVVLTCTYLV